MLRDYELGFILSSEVSEEQTHAIVEHIKQIAARYDGQVVRVNHWGRRRLSYPIKHQRDGIYVFIDMILSPKAVVELDRMVRVSEEILRHLMKRRDPKIVQKEREEHIAREAALAAVAATPVVSDEVASDVDIVATVPAAVPEIAEEEIQQTVASEDAEISMPLAVVGDIDDVSPAIEETIET